MLTEKANLRLREVWTWLFYGVFGGIGLLNVWHGRDNSSLMAMGALGLVSVPMIVLHELGHLFAGKAFGLNVYELNIGTGDLLWRGKVVGLEVSLRMVPFSGYVSHIPGTEATQLARLFFVAGGPIANLLAMGICWWARGDEIWPRMSQWTFLDMGVVANAWLLVFTLIPHRVVISTTGAVIGTDGWTIWQLLRGRSLEEMAKQLGPLPNSAGMVGLRKLARKRKVYGVIGIATIILFSGAIAALLFSSGQEGAIKAAWWICALPAVCLVWLIYGLRRDSVAALDLATKASASPLTAYMGRVSLELIPLARAEVVQLPAGIGVLVAKGAVTEEQADAVESAIVAAGSLPCLAFSQYDILVARGALEKALEVARAVSQASVWTPPVRAYFDAVILRTELKLHPGSHFVDDFDRAISDSNDDGMRQFLLIQAASVAMDTKQDVLLPHARRWLEASLAVFPFDLLTMVELARYHRLKEDWAAAEKLLKQAERAANTAPLQSLVRRNRLVLGVGQGLEGSVSRAQKFLQSELSLQERLYFLQDLEGLRQWPKGEQKSQASR